MVMRSNCVDFFGDRVFVVGNFVCCGDFLFVFVIKLYVGELGFN